MADNNRNGVDDSLELGGQVNRPAVPQKPVQNNAASSGGFFSAAEIEAASRSAAAGNQQQFQVLQNNKSQQWQGFPFRLPTADQATLPYTDSYNGGFLGIQDDNLASMVVDASGGNPAKYDAVYRQALHDAAFAQRAGKSNVTVEGLLTKWGKSGVPEQGTGGGGSAGGPFHSTVRSVSLTDQGTANQIINQSLTRYLGRQATQQEQQAFLRSLNVQEKQNATVTVTNGNRSADGKNTTQSSTTTGGFNRDDFAEKFSKSQEGYAEYQTATTYLDAFIGALQDPTKAL